VDVYNYSLGGWEQFWSSCGTSTLSSSDGWVVWEAYNIIDTGACPSIKGVSATDIRFLDSSSGFGQANPITNSAYSNDVNGSFATDIPCFDDGGGYSYTFPWSTSPVNSWTAATPNP